MGRKKANMIVFMHITGLGALVIMNRALTEGQKLDLQWLMNSKLRPRKYI